jgi:hypothetical protein
MMSIHPDGQRKFFADMTRKGTRSTVGKDKYLVSGNAFIRSTIADTLIVQRVFQPAFKRLEDGNHV